MICIVEIDVDRNCHMALLGNEWRPVTYVKKVFEFKDGSLQDVDTVSNVQQARVVPEHDCECPSIIFAYCKDETEYYNLVKMVSLFELGLPVNAEFFPPVFLVYDFITVVLILVILIHLH